jgi:hypothetical protein
VRHSLSLSSLCLISVYSGILYVCVADVDIFNCVRLPSLSPALYISPCVSPPFSVFPSVSVFLLFMSLWHTHHNLEVEVRPVQQSHVAGQQVPGWRVRRRRAHLTATTLCRRRSDHWTAAGARTPAPRPFGGPPAAPESQHDTARRRRLCVYYAE